MGIIVAAFCLAIYGTAGYNLEECYSNPNCQVSNVDTTFSTTAVAPTTGLAQ